MLFHPECLETFLQIWSFKKALLSWTPAPNVQFSPCLLFHGFQKLSLSSLNRKRGAAPHLGQSLPQPPCRWGPRPWRSGQWVLSEKEILALLTISPKPTWSDGTSPLLTLSQKRCLMFAWYLWYFIILLLYLRNNIDRANCSPGKAGYKNRMTLDSYFC